MTVMGDASMDGLSDAGSIPARSTYEVARRTPEATVIVVRFGIVLACKLQI